MLGERPGSSQTPRCRFCAADHASSHSRHNSHDTCNPSGDHTVVCNVYFPLRRVLRHDGSGRERPGESMAYAVAVMLFIHEPYIYDRNTFDQPCSHSIECTTLYVSSGTSTRPTEAGRFWGKSKSKTAECCMHLYCILFFVPVSCIHDYN